MKGIRALLLILLTFVLIFALSACNFSIDFGENENNNNNNNDNDNDNDNDNGDNGDGDTVSIPLIEDGEAKFQIVYDNTRGASIKNTANAFAKRLAALGIDVEVVEDKESNAKECEILFGDIKSRGENYDYDEHTLGKKGYVVTCIDKKIIVAADGLEILIAEFELLADAIIEALYDSDGESFTYTNENESIYVQDDYLITSLSMNGVSLRDYVIAIDKTDADIRNAAQSIQDTIYQRVGYWLEILPLDEKTDKSIVINYVDKELAGGESFVVKGMKNGNIEISFSYYNALGNAVLDFLASEITLKMGEVDFGTGKIFEKDISKVYYADYDELTDNDKTNDFEALMSVHNYANEGGQTVIGERGATYYISLTGGKQITIMTNVIWDGCFFVVDDRDIVKTNYVKESPHIFNIASSQPKNTYTVNTDRLGIVASLNARDGAKISTADTHLPLNLGFDAIIIPYDNSKEMYMRCSEQGVPGAGHAQHEPIIVRADNTIDETAKPLFDFEKIDSIYVRSIEDEPITISGGKFTQYATRTDMISLNRGFAVVRSNVTITDMDHYVTNQPVNGVIDSDSNGARYNGGGPNYNGWIVPSTCHNLLVKDSKLSGRAHYRQGSYDIGGTNSNKLVYKNCTQYYMYIDDDQSKGVWNETKYYWGIMGTSYCKNIEYHDSTLSRLDAHAGVVNVTVKGCIMRSIGVVGGGIINIEDTTVYSNSVLGFRQDYGSTWRGDVIIKNCTLIPTSTKLSVLTGKIHNTTFGFTTALPTNIYLENITYDTDLEIEEFAASNFMLGPAYLTVAPTIINPFSTVKSIKIKQPTGFEFDKINATDYTKTAEVYYLYEEDSVEYLN